MNTIKDEILSLKKEKSALVLAHYYETLDVQGVADYVCDSYEMAKRAKEAKEQIIVICGVHFMAESAKILSPGKKVLIPRPDAGCPMANMVTPEGVLEMRKRHPDAAVVCYVNSSAAVKAVSDVCCTSSSVLRLVRSLSEKKVIFIPDCNLGRFVAAQIPEKEIILWNGFCPVHNAVSALDVIKAKEEMPDALFLAHPECREEVLSMADFIGSTAQIIDFAAMSEAERFIIGTETEITKRLQRDLPQKTFRTVTDTFTCVNMKKTTLQDIHKCLKEEKYEISLTQDELEGAKKSLERMVSI